MYGHLRKTKIHTKDEIYLWQIRYEMNDLKLTKEEKNNINLIEKRVNSTGVIYKENIGDMKKEIEHSSSKSTMEELYKIRKDYGIYLGKEMER